MLHVPWQSPKVTSDSDTQLSKAITLVTFLFAHVPSELGIVVVVDNDCSSVVVVVVVVDVIVVEVPFVAGDGVVLLVVNVRFPLGMDVVVLTVVEEPVGVVVLSDPVLGDTYTDDVVLLTKGVVTERVVSDPVTSCELGRTVVSGVDVVVEVEGTSGLVTTDISDDDVDEMGVDVVVEDDGSSIQKSTSMASILITFSEFGVKTTFTFFPGTGLDNVTLSSSDVNSSTGISSLSNIVTTNFSYSPVTMMSVIGFSSSVMVTVISG